MTPTSAGGSPGAALPAPGGGASLKGRAIRASGWTLAGFGASRLIRLASNLVLTRLLFPEAFGVMALINTLIHGLAMFSDIGIGVSIVQNERGDDRAFLNTAWTLQVIRGAFLMLVGVGIAWPAAAFYQQPDLRFLIPVASSSALILGFQSTSLFTLNRHLSLARVNLLNLGSQIAAVVVMVSWAWVSPSVWALVAGSVLSDVVKVWMSHRLLPGERNRFHWDRSAAKAMAHLGRWIFLSTFLTFLAMQLDRLILGRLLTMAAFGVYSVAATFAMMPTEIATKLLLTVAFPVYSRARGQGLDLPKIFARTRTIALSAGGSAAVGLASLGSALIEILYDSRYHDAGWILQVLAVGAWFQILESKNNSLLLALGKANWLAFANIGKLLGMAIFLPIGFRRFDLAGAVAGLVLAETMKYAITALAVTRQGFRTVAADAAFTAYLAFAGFTSAGAWMYLRRDVDNAWIPLAVAAALLSVLLLPLGLRSLRAVRQGK